MYMYIYIYMYLFNVVYISFPFRCFSCPKVHCHSTGWVVFFRPAGSPVKFPRKRSACLSADLQYLLQNHAENRVCCKYSADMTYGIQRNQPKTSATSMSSTAIGHFARIIWHHLSFEKDVRQYGTAAYLMIVIAKSTSSNSNSQQIPTVWHPRHRMQLDSSVNYCMQVDFFEYFCTFHIFSYFTDKGNLENPEIRSKDDKGIPCIKPT